jgi:S-adenosylmethionine uptake transporter
MAATNPASLRGALFALTAFGLYSTHDVFVKFLGGIYSPFQIVFFSTLFGFPVIAVMMMRDPADGNLRPRHPWLIALRALLTVVTAGAAFYAFARLPMAETYAIVFASPMLITVLAIPVLGEQVGWRRWLAVIVGLGGVLVVLQPGVTPLSLGHAAALVAAVCSAVAAVIVRKIGAEERTSVLMLYPMVGTLLVMGFVMPFVYRPMEGLHLAAVALMAVVGMTGGFALIAAYRSASAGVVAPMQYSQMLWAVLYGALFFGETPSPSTAIGAAIIIASGVYIVFREEQPDVSRNTPVLETRSRYSIGTMPRISTLLRLFGKEP